MRRDGTGEDGAGRGTGRDFKKRIKRDRTGRDKKVRDAGQDGMNFWLSRGALVTTNTEPHNH